ncbi:MAG TPA: TrmH family RNA methyltransferase [Candidatus Saccharimonadia bacterium]
MVQLTLILDNLRSAYNIGAILRTCDAAGVHQVFACGTTPYPKLKNDSRDPVISGRNTREIAKTALGAEKTVMVEHFNDTASAINYCRAHKWTLIGLEQSSESKNLFEYSPPQNIALIVGNEVEGLNAEALGACDIIAEIPQRGTKESLNVSVATGVALYTLLF